MTSGALGNTAENANDAIDHQAVTKDDTMKLQIPQLIGLAQAAGFSGPDLQTAVAIALAESGGDPQAYNPEKAAGAAQGHGSYGLWQIYITSHPEFATVNLLDPTVNAGAAFSVYTNAGNSFQPWSTYKSGAYLSYMDAVGQVLSTSTTGDDGSNGNLDTGQILTMVIAGGFIFWLISRIGG